MVEKWLNQDRLCRKGIFSAFGGFNMAKNDGIYMVLCAFPAQNPVNIDGFKLCRLQNGHKDPAVFPKTEPVFLKTAHAFAKNGALQNWWQISPKSVTDFPKNRVRFSQKSSQFFPNTEPLFAKTRAKFHDNRTNFSPNRNQIFTETPACLSQAKYSNPNR